MFRKDFNKVLELSQNKSKNRDLRNRVAAVQKNAFEHLTESRELLVGFEELNDIDERWTPDTEKWRRAAQYVEIRKYQLALDKLEGLVVQRLFELAKMGLSGTGNYIFYLSSWSALISRFRLQTSYSHQQVLEDSLQSNPTCACSIQFGGQGN